MPDQVAVAESWFSVKGHGYCYSTGRKPISCLLNNLTEILFSSQKKTFLASVFKSVNFQNIFFCIAINNEFGDKKSLDRKNRVGSFCSIRIIWGSHFVIRKGKNTRKKHFGVQQNRTNSCATMRIWNIVSSQSFFPSSKSWKFCKKDANQARLWTF